MAINSLTRADGAASCALSRACPRRERAQHSLNRAAANPELATNPQYAHAAVVEPQDALFKLSPAHAPALFICTPLAILLVAAT
jgi:hypothetical protein